MSGRDFIHAIHVSYGVLYSKIRSARGRQNLGKKCRRGCDTVETLNHVLQQCHHTHFARIKRRNALMDYVPKVGHDRGMSVHKEPVFKVGGRKLIPNLVIYNPDRVVLVDAQVVNEQFPLERGHSNKVEKYSSLGDQLAGLRTGGIPMQHPDD